jgi:hopanoid-associated phosphorylase
MAPIGIIVAMLPEAACLVSPAPEPGVSIQLRPNILMHLCGIGAEPATRGAEHLVARGVRGLVSFGTAGGLAPELAPGAVLLPGRVETAAGVLFTHEAWRIHVRERLTAAGLTLAPGDMTEADTVVTTSGQKAALGAERNAAAVDMESAAVLRVANRHVLPALVLRVIFDPMEMELPAFVLRQSDDYGRANVPGVLLDLLRAPARLPALLKVNHAFRAAARSMRSVGENLHHLHPGHDALTLPR